jgi:hypothetical protein
MIVFDRQGDNLRTIFGPTDGEGNLLQGQYKRIVQDGLGEYLALNASTLQINRLDTNLNFSDVVQLEYEPGVNITVRDILNTLDGFIIIGSIPASGLNNNAICAKFDFGLNMVWHYSYISRFPEYYRLINTSDGGYLFSWSYNPSRFFFKVNALGDSLWCATCQSIEPSKLIESDNKYYGLYYSDYDITSGRLFIYSFGEDFSLPNPTEPILTIVTCRLLSGDEVFSLLRTADNNIVLAVSTPYGEIFKYDSDFTLIWSADYLANDRIGAGQTPVIELSNGDLLYCARIMGQSSFTERFALVRIDTNGHVTGVEDNSQDAPAVNHISVYPNPFSHDLKISFKSEIEPNSEIAIYNIKGQLLDSVIVKTETIIWKPNNLAAGIYVITYKKTNKSIASVKVLYNK